MHKKSMHILYKKEVLSPQQDQSFQRPFYLFGSMM